MPKIINKKLHEEAMKEFPKVSVGTPWSDEEIKNAVTLLQLVYNLNAQAEKKAGIAIDVYKATEKLQMLFAHIGELENAAKMGQSNSNYETFKTLANECMTLLHIPNSVIPQLDDKNYDWGLEKAHNFQYLLSYLLYARAVNPYDDWKKWTEKANNKNGAIDSFKTLYTGYVEGISERNKAKAQDTINAITEACKYSNTELTDEQKKYLTAKRGLERDLCNLYEYANGHLDCSENTYKELLERISENLPVSKNARMPRFSYVAEKDEIPTTALTKAIEEYTNGLKGYIDRAKREEQLEQAIGKPDSKFKFDIKQYKDDIDKCFIYITDNPDANKLTFIEKESHTENIEKLINYVQDNNALLDQNVQIDDIKNSAMITDYEVEYILQRQMKMVFEPDSVDGVYEPVKLLAERDASSREYIKTALQKYANIPKQHLLDQTKWLIKKTAKNAYTPVFTRLRDSDYANYTHAEDEVKKTFFEEDVTDLILEYCSKDRGFDNQRDLGKLETSISDMVRWLSDEGNDFRIYDIDTIQEDDIQNERIDYQEAEQSFMTYMSSLKFLNSISKQIGLEGLFDGKVYDRWQIQKDLIAFRNHLMTRDLEQTFTDIRSELHGQNEADANAKWSELSYDKLLEAKNVRQAILDKIEKANQSKKELAQNGNLIGETDGLKDFDANELSIIKNNIKTIEKQAEKVYRENYGIFDKEPENSDDIHKKIDLPNNDIMDDSIVIDNNDQQNGIDNVVRNEGDWSNRSVDDQKFRNYKFEEPPIVDKKNNVSFDRGKSNAADNNADYTFVEDNLLDHPVEFNEMKHKNQVNDDNFRRRFLNNEHLNLDTRDNILWRGRTYDILIAINEAVQAEHPNKNSPFVAVKNAMNTYVSALKNCGFDTPDGIVQDLGDRDYDKEKLEQITQDKGVKEAAKGLYSACKTYMERHIETKINEKGNEYKVVTGQLHGYGRIRKQAAVAVMAIFAELPEGQDIIVEADRKVNEANHRDKICSKDFMNLRRSLRRANNSTENSFIDLKKVMKEQQKMHKKVLEDKKRAEPINEKAANQNGMHH